MSSELVPVTYEFDEETAVESAALLLRNGVKATVEVRRGSFAVLVRSDQAEAAITTLGLAHQEIDEPSSRWRFLAGRAAVAVLLILVVGLLARSVWGIAALWIVLVVGGGLSWALYIADDSERPYRGD